MEIKLIKRELKNGRTSLVLEYYLGYTLGANGTTRPKRKFETLEYFLYTTPRNKAERDHNKINLEMAEKVKAKRAARRAERAVRVRRAVQDPHQPGRVYPRDGRAAQGFARQLGQLGQHAETPDRLCGDGDHLRTDRPTVRRGVPHLPRQGGPHEERHRPLGQQPEQLLSEIQGGIEPGRRGGDRPPIARHGGQGHANRRRAPRIPHD